MRKPATGEPCAGEPPARFGGRGGQLSRPLSRSERCRPHSAVPDLAPLRPAPAVGFPVRAALLAFLAWVCLTWACLAQGLTFPALTGRVVDEAALLNDADRAALTATLADLEAKTGDQLVVATLKSLQGTSIEDYGYQLGRKWGIGQKGKNTGALLIVVPSEHLVRIEVGYGLEGALTDAATKTIIETVILPRFRANDFAGGIRNGTDQIVHVLTADAAINGPPAAPASAPLDEPIWPVVLVVLGCAALLIFCVVTGGGLCQILFQILYMVVLSSGRGGSSGGGSSSFSGRGGSFGGGGSSGRW